MVDIPLIGVGQVTIVAGISDSISIGVELFRVFRLWTDVAEVSELVSITVELIRVR